MVQALFQSQRGNDELEPVFVDFLPGELKGEQDVRLCVQGGDEVEALENEADSIASKLCQLAVFKRRDIGIFNEYGS